MNRTDNYWKLGLFVLLGVALAVGAAVWLGLDRLNRQFFVVYAYFDEPVDGLSLGSPVKFRGVEIGEVARIRAAADRKHVEVASHIFQDALLDLRLRDPDEKLPPGETIDARAMADLRVQLVRSPLTGIAYIQSDFFDPNEYPPTPYPFATNKPMIYTIPSTWRRIEGRLLETLGKLPDLVDRVDQSLRVITAGITSANVDQLSRSLRMLSDRAAAKLDEFDIKRVIDHADHVLTQGTQTLDAVEQLVQDLRDKNGPLSNALTRTAALMRRIEQQVAQSEVGATMRELRAAAAAVRTTAEGLDRAGTTFVHGFRDSHRLITSLRRLLDLLERDPGALLRGRARAATRK